MHSEMHAHLECTDLKSLTHSLLFHLREHLQKYSDQQSYNMINLFTVSLTVSERAKDFMPPLQLLHLETFLFFPCPFTGFSLWLSLQCRRPGFDPQIGKIPWRREMPPTPVIWPREFHGLHSPWGCKESDKTECLSLCLAVNRASPCLWLYHSEVLHKWSASLSGLHSSFISSRAAVPTFLGPKDQFHGRQFFHRPGWGEMVSG